MGHWAESFLTYILMYTEAIGTFCLSFFKKIACSKLWGSCYWCEIVCIPYKFTVRFINRMSTFSIQFFQGVSIQPVHPKADQSWVFIGRTDVEAETPILWPPDVKTWLIEKRPWCWERSQAEGEGGDGSMASPARWTWVWASSESWRWQASLASCSSWGREESDTNERLNWTKKNHLESPPFVMSPKALNKYHLIAKWRIRSSNKRRHSGKLWEEKTTEYTDRHGAEKSTQLPPFVASGEQQE